MDDKKYQQAIERYETPFYVFDLDLLAEQVSKIRAALGENIELCYAMKANPFIIKALEKIVDHFEVCSPGEFNICERAGIDMHKIVLSGINKKENDIKYMLSSYESKGIYTIESLKQWQLIEGYATEHKLPVHVLLRLTMGNQFGMDEEIIRQLIAENKQHPYVNIEGIQFFSGTQKKALGKFHRELTMLDEFIHQLEEDCQFTVKKLEYGPGLPICYFEDEENVEDAMLEELSKQLKALKFKGKIVLEMGRFIAAPCGDYFTEVVDLKVNKNQNYCIVDGGIHQMNYFGQMMAMKKPPIIHYQEGSGETKQWTVCGSLCTINDVLVKQYPFINLSVKDVLIFGRIGAYSVTEGISLFLSRELPQVVLYSKEKGFSLAREHFKTDLLNYFKNI